MQIFNKIKGRGVEDIFLLSMDGVSGLESGAKAIFKDVIVPAGLFEYSKISNSKTTRKSKRKYRRNTPPVS